MWATAAVLTLRRMVPPVALLLAVPLYVVVMSLPLYDLGPPGGGGGVLSHTTEFHLVPILAVAYLVAQSGAISPLVAGAVCLAGTGALFVDLDGLTLARGFDWSRCCSRCSWWRAPRSWGRSCVSSGGCERSSRRRWWSRSAPASPASCTTWSPTT